MTAQRRQLETRVFLPEKQIDEDEEFQITLLGLFEKPYGELYEGNLRRERRSLFMM